MTMGGGDRVCSNNPDHKVGMIAQRIQKVLSLISLWALEFQCPNILTYLMNVSCMDDMNKTCHRDRIACLTASCPSHKKL